MCKSWTDRTFGISDKSVESSCESMDLGVPSIRTVRDEKKSLKVVKRTMNEKRNVQIGSMMTWRDERVN